MTTPPATPPTPAAAPQPQAPELPPLWSGTCPNGCPVGDCYCPDGSEPRYCGHGPGGTCEQGHCLDCDACSCGDDW